MQPRKFREWRVQCKALGFFDATHEDRGKREEIARTAWSKAEHVRAEKERDREIQCVKGGKKILYTTGPIELP